MFEQFFKFPTIMIDGDNEERKEKRSDILNTNESEYDIIYGEAEYPYYDFLGIEDRWLPTDESFERALNGKFDACLVRFANVGSLLVPWPRSKFKKELQKFSETTTKKPDKLVVLNLTRQQIDTLSNG